MADSTTTMTAGLMPSQVVRSSSSVSGNGNGGGGGVDTKKANGNSSNANVNANGSANANGNNKARKNRNRRKSNTTANNAAKNSETTSGENTDTKTTKDDSQQQSQNESNQKPKAKRRNRRKPKNNNNNNKNENVDGGTGKETEQDAPESQKNETANTQKNTNNNNANSKKGRNARSRNKKKKYPWRKHIPAGSVDPITLEALVSLTYPPFALRSSTPYLPVPEWPPNEGTEAAEEDKKKQMSQADAAKEWERKMLQEQWGKTAVLPSSEKEEEQVEPVIESVNPKHLNLFDGRALAYYMVSQLQFIDPLNRRDLKRDELCHLDRYLVRHGFDDLNVVEAYDTKGVSLSSAGAASTTAAGRAEILQQEARVLLNALFGHSATSGRPPSQPRSNNSNNTNSLQSQYSNYQAAQQQFEREQEQGFNQYSRNNDNVEETGIYGDDSGGVLVIDDDLNPSLRGNRDLRPIRSTPNASNSGNMTLWSASRVTAQHGHQANLQEQHFPALSSTAALPPNRSSLSSSAPSYQPAGVAAASSSAAPAPAPKPNKPPPPAKTLKFISKAVKKTSPEEAQRQFEAREEARKKAMLSNLTFGSNPASTAADPMAPPPLAPTEAQLQRNRAFAEALGVQAPPPAAAKLQGWARPTDVTVPNTVYPDALILQARENMGALLKLERKWKTFLEDDKAASLPLNKMDRDLRKFVHEYSDSWKIYTESFDPEPMRYIHCVKLLDTSAPCPLLSDAARSWRGPTGNVASSEHALQQTAGQDTRGRELSDLPKAPAASLESNSRAAALRGEERPKLELKERTLPLELPPFQPPAKPEESELDTEELLRRRQAKQEEQKRKQKEREERKQQVLQAAFASDSEEESLGRMDDDSDWEEAEELYPGTDDEHEAVEATV